MARNVRDSGGGGGSVNVRYPELRAARDTHSRGIEGISGSAPYPAGMRSASFLFIGVAGQEIV